MLLLPNDGLPRGTLLDKLLRPKGAVAAIVAAIAGATPPLADRLAAGLLPGDPKAIVGKNDSGDAQKALDVGAHEHMVSALGRAGVRLVLSEEAEEVICLDPDGAYDVAIDPIDGSGSIGIGAPLGLLFSVLPAAPEGFLRSGRAIVAAGYASFGHSTDFGFSLGNGVTIATFDRDLGGFRISHEQVQLSAQAETIAYNASNERHWPDGLKSYALDLRAGRDGPRGRDFNMRWLAAAVGELHRILLVGGFFMYPADRRKGYESGRLRLIYEAGPIAFLIEQAGGAATDGQSPILDRTPSALHEHSPLIFGAAEEVEIVGRYLSAPSKD
ncbi:MAG: class 1 fructose-bisphosphatase [Paracoccaceae bacterium]|nr:class 1 fructose-bisphosphatase [Paracoccaceae bacterium]